MRRILKGRGRFVLCLSACLLIFFGPIYFSGKGFYHGDYKQQFYPWAYVLSQGLKSFSLPLWRPDIGCGFPLLAEGQSAALYPIHWLLCFLLPFPLSYHAGFILLFILSGVFSYLFFRQCSMTESGATFACIVFLFGSAYAGLFYGLMALRTLVWFPLSLYGIEKLSQRINIRGSILVAFSWAMAFLGGYPQMAVYSVIAGFLYFIFRILSNGHKKAFFCYFLIAIVLSAGLSAVQVLPTLQMALASARGHVGADFALQRSFNPLNVTTLLWPGMGAFMGFDFYVGLFPLLLAFFSLSAFKKNKFVAFFIFQMLFFLWMALGRFNPFYAMLIKISHIGFFRVPSKFIFFSCFSLAALSGIGLDLLTGSSEVKARFFRISIRIFYVAVAIFASAWASVRFLRPTILEWGQKFVRQSVFGKTGHPHSLEDYFIKLSNLLDLAAQRTALTDPHFLISLGLWVIFFHPLIRVETK